MKNVLVYPAGSEIGLEIIRSLQFQKNIKVFGANNEEENFASLLCEVYPLQAGDSFIEELNTLIKKLKIDVLFPGNDFFCNFFSQNNEKICTKIINSNKKTNKICFSKLKTYNSFSKIIPTPEIYDSKTTIKFPCFLKPETGHSSQNCMKVEDQEDLKEKLNLLKKITNPLILEFLPGKEYTIDCFTFNDKLLTVKARERIKTFNGISSASKEVSGQKNLKIIKKYAEKINKKLKFQGSWFFQLKKDKKGRLKLLEIAPRISGGSGTWKIKGLNFSLLSFLSVFEDEIKIKENMALAFSKKSLQTKFEINLDQYKKVYFDLDDTFIFQEKLNHYLISFLFKCIEEDKKVVLITRHKKNLRDTLKKKRIGEVFDEIIHITNGQSKWSYIDENSIFVDDSFKERFEDLSKESCLRIEPEVVRYLI